MRRFWGLLSVLCLLFFGLSLTGCMLGGGHGGGGGGGNGGGGGGGGGGQQVVGIGIQSVLANGFTAGGTGTFTIVVGNAGGKSSSSTTTLTAALGSTFTFISANGSGWNCGASVGAQVNCTYSASIVGGMAAPTLTITVNVSGSASGPGQITFNVANPDGVVPQGANFTVNYSVTGNSGGGTVGGSVTITMPEPAISSPELVVSGVANARTTATLQAVATLADNGAGIDWYVCLGSYDVNFNPVCNPGPPASNPVLGGNSTLGMISSNGHSASGAFVTYTAPAALPAAPDNNFVVIFAQQPGTGGAGPGIASNLDPNNPTSVAAYIVTTNNEIPTGSFAEGANFVFRLRGFTSPSGLAYGIIGRFHVNGVGAVSNGIEDVNITQPDGSSVVYTKVPFTGTYNMDTSSHGILNLTVTSPAPWTTAPVPTNPPPSTMTLPFTLDDQAFMGKLIEAEPTGNYTGSGIMRYQGPLAVFTSTKISGSYVFSLATPLGTGSNATHHGVIGRVDLVTGTSTTMGTVATTSTVDDDSGNATQTVTGGTYTLDGASGDHGTFTVSTSSSSSPSTTTFYAADRRHLFLLGADPDTTASSRGILLGGAVGMAVDAAGNPRTFSNTSLARPFIFTALGNTPSSAANSGHASGIIGKFSGTAGAAGAGTLAGIFDMNDGGTVPAGPLSMTGATFTIGTDGRGRGTISVPVNGVTYHFVFYFIGPGRGLLQEQPASDLTKRARNGEFVIQTITAPIQIPATGLTFVAGTRTDTATSLNSDAVFQLNGAASPVSFTGTADTSRTGLPSQTPVPDTGRGTLTITDQTNGRGTITATTPAIGGSAGAVFYVEDPSEVLVMGTDSTLTDPQIITLDQ